DLGDRRGRAGEVDRHDAIGTRAALGLTGRPAFHHLEPLAAWPVAGLSVAARGVEMRGEMEHLAELLGVAFVETVEIDLQHLLDRRDFRAHRLSSVFRSTRSG